MPCTAPPRCRAHSVSLKLFWRKIVTTRKTFSYSDAIRKVIWLDGPEILWSISVSVKNSKLSFEKRANLKFLLLCVCVSGCVRLCVWVCVFVRQSVSGCDEGFFGVTAISVILGLKGDSNSYDFLFILFSENTEAINKKRHFAFRCWPGNSFQVISWLIGSVSANFFSLKRNLKKSWSCRLEI